MSGYPGYMRDGVDYTKCGECRKETRSNETHWFEDKLLCLPCHKSVTTPLIESFTEDYENGACDGEEEIKCPYCGHDNEPVDLFDGGEPKEWTCGRCGLEFDLEIEYSYTFSTERKREDAAHE
ncbi:hypothetical protein PAECIP111893_00284 [Paenibacillus plantiphilus]|uniref:Uncharacterized protein n=1 Tax=Paenibacillus plantiphilus TaxID=2905650 RepID=A0ABN8FT91_9BACL|nr:hypothetical protein [Paenibacillus plantiphilus]CAH1190342.1 hypothetical protein PAECIP111893_00284 [Paenibacillus plantiphilus]